MTYPRVGRPVVVRIRHGKPPAPLGCRWCGFGERDHAQQWVPSHGWHVYVEPTRAQVEARMKAKFAAKDAAA